MHQPHQSKLVQRISRPSISHIMDPMSYGGCSLGPVALRTPSMVLLFHIGASPLLHVVLVALCGFSSRLLTS